MALGKVQRVMCFTAGMQCLVLNMQCLVLNMPCLVLNMMCFIQSMMCFIESMMCFIQSTMCFIESTMHSNGLMMGIILNMTCSERPRAALTRHVWRQACLAESMSGGNMPIRDDAADLCPNRGGRIGANFPKRPKSASPANGAAVCAVTAGFPVHRGAATGSGDRPVRAKAISSTRPSAWRRGGDRQAARRRWAERMRSGCATRRTISTTSRATVCVCATRGQRSGRLTRLLVGGAGLAIMHHQQRLAADGRAVAPSSASSSPFAPAPGVPAIMKGPWTGEVGVHVRRPGRRLLTGDRWCVGGRCAQRSRLEVWPAQLDRDCCAHGWPPGQAVPRAMAQSPRPVHPQDALYE